MVAFWKAGFDLAKKKKGKQDRDRTGRDRTRTGSSMLQDRTHTGQHRTTEDWLRGEEPCVRRLGWDWWQAGAQVAGPQGGTLPVLVRLAKIALADLIHSSISSTGAMFFFLKICS